MVKQLKVKASDPGDRKPVGPPSQNPPPRPENPPITKDQPGGGAKPVRPENVRVTEAVERDKKD